MTDISFFTPVEYTIFTTPGQRIIEAVDAYFYLGGRVAEVIPKTIENDRAAIKFRYKKAICWQTALKIASYVFFIIPLLMLAAKAIFRFAFHFYEQKKVTRKPHRAWIPKEPEFPLPREIKSHIFSYLEPKDLSLTTTLNKDYYNLSQRKKIEWLNDHKVSIEELGLNFEGMKTLLKEEGEHLKYLEVKGSTDQILELIPLCPNLEILHIEAKYVEDWHFIRLVSYQFPKLETLIVKNINYTGKITQGIKDLAVSDHFPNLKHLHLHDLTTTSKSMRFGAFINSQNFRNLQSLTIKGGRLGSRELFNFANNPNFSNLEMLDLSDNYFYQGDLQIKAFSTWAKSQNFLKLKTLDLSNNRLSTGVLDILAMHGHPNLQKLEYHNNSIIKESKKVIERILTSPEYPQLNYLSLKMNENLFKHFADSPVLSKMNIEVYQLPHPPIDRDNERHYI